MNEDEYQSIDRNNLIQAVFNDTCDNLIQIYLMPELGNKLFYLPCRLKINWRTDTNYTKTYPGASIPRRLAVKIIDLCMDYNTPS